MKLVAGGHLKQAVILLNVDSKILPGIYQQSVDWADSYKNNI